MLVLFDQGTPVPIRPFLKEHTVQTTAERGWDTLENGELLKAAEAAGFDVLVTPDKNIRYQQNLTVRTIALVVLGNPQWPCCACMWSVSSLPSTRRDRAVTRKSKYLNFNRRYWMRPRPSESAPPWIHGSDKISARCQSEK